MNVKLNVKFTFYVTEQTPKVFVDLEKKETSFFSTRKKNGIEVLLQLELHL